MSLPLEKECKGEASLNTYRYLWGKKSKHLYLLTILSVYTTKKRIREWITFMGLVSGWDILLPWIEDVAVFLFSFEKTKLKNPGYETVYIGYVTTMKYIWTKHLKLLTHVYSNVNAIQRKIIHEPWHLIFPAHIRLILCHEKRTNYCSLRVTHKNNNG